MKEGDPAMDAVSYQDYVNILKEELVPAMGCTEPIAIAYAGPQSGWKWRPAGISLKM